MQSWWALTDCWTCPSQSRPRYRWPAHPGRGARRWRWSRRWHTWDSRRPRCGHGSSSSSCDQCQEDEMRSDVLASSYSVFNIIVQTFKSFPLKKTWKLRCFKATSSQYLYEHVFISSHEHSQQRLLYPLHYHRQWCWVCVGCYCECLALSSAQLQCPSLLQHCDQRTQCLESIRWRRWQYNCSHRDIKQLSDDDASDDDDESHWYNRCALMS